MSKGNALMRLPGWVRAERMPEAVAARKLTWMGYPAHGLGTLG